MRPPFDSASPSVASPVATIDELRQAQLKLAELGAIVEHTEQIPLARAIGRITATSLLEGYCPSLHLVGTPSQGRDGSLPAGLRLEVTHLPRLAAAGLSSIEVFRRLRVGVIALADAGEYVQSGSQIHAPRLPTGATLAALVESLGAQAFEATCQAASTAANECMLAQTLEMFLSKCDLVLICGFLTPRQCEIVRRALAGNGAESSVETVALRPIGALQIARSEQKLAVSVSADLDSAFSTFVLLVSPLIRRMQGRREQAFDSVPCTLTTEVVLTPEAWGAFYVKEISESGTQRRALQPCADDDAAIALGQATGLAWRTADLPLRHRSAVAYYPFHQWLT